MKTKKAYNCRHLLSLQEGGYAVGGSPQKRPLSPFRKGFPPTLPLHFPPNVYPRPIQICLSPSFPRRSASHPQTTLPCQGPTDTPIPPNLCPGPAPAWRAPTGEIGRGQAERKTAFVHRPQQLTLVTRNAMASSSTGSNLVGRSKELEPPTSRGPESNTDQQPFLCSTLGDAGPCLKFKPRTAPSLLACLWHSLPSHWRLRVPPRMRLQGDPAETYERGAEPEPLAHLV